MKIVVTNNNLIVRTNEDEFQHSVNEAIRSFLFYVTYLINYNKCNIPNIVKRQTNTVRAHFYTVANSSSSGCQWETVILTILSLIIK